MNKGLGRDLTVLFGLCDAGRGVPQVLNPSILIIWTKIKVVGLGMLSAGQHLAVLRQNMLATKPHIAISEHILTAHNR